VTHGHRLDPRKRHLETRLSRAHESVQARPSGALGSGEGPTDGPEPAVERELTDCSVAREAIGRNLSRRRQHCKRDRQIEPRPFLPELGGSEVDRDPAVRPNELGRRDPAPHAFLRLLARAIRKTDNREGRNAQLEMSLDLDAASIETHERMRDRSREHRLRR
jgi:hypothetical protein